MTMTEPFSRYNFYGKVFYALFFALSELIRRWYNSLANLFKVLIIEHNRWTLFALKYDRYTSSLLNIDSMQGGGR